MATRMSAEPTGHKRGVRIALTTLALVLALPMAAEAKSFRGKTSQDRLASVVVGDDGFVTRIRISYSAPCTDPRYRFPNVLRIEPPFDEVTTDEVTEEVMLRDRLDGGGRSRQTATITAERTRRLERGRVLERDVQDARRAHEGPQADRHLRAQARDVVRRAGLIALLERTVR